MKTTALTHTSFSPSKERVIPLSTPEIRGNEWRYIKECLDTGWVSSVGAFVDQFERAMSQFVKADFAVATVNGTAALHVALLVSGVQPDDEVLVSTLTFIAPANAIRYVRAWPIFIDAEPNYWQMDPRKVQEFLEKQCLWIDGTLRNKSTGRQVKGIIPVHILGHPVDMDPILEMAVKYRLTVIEDATESLGSKYKDRMTGSLGHIGCFSFNGNKIITTGGGGMIVTNNEAWAQKAKYLTTQAKDDPVEFIHGEIGYNYRLTNIQAAMGCAQLESLNNYVERKRAIAARYCEGLKTLEGITCPQQAGWVRSVFWMFTILVNGSVCGFNSRQFRQRLKPGIETRPLWQPVHLSPAHRQHAQSFCPVAERLYQQGLSLPSSVGLTDIDQDRVIDALRAIHQNGCRDSVT